MSKVTVIIEGALRDIFQYLNELAKQIVNPEFSIEKIKKFNKRFHYKLDGKATERVAEYIFGDLLEGR
ncbi:hypothetical protein [Metasolibacillus sp. FSL K6-0083]|uniref:hypothetical protein n=1 Tax=Metasolibacillus sp. FSL K6-0083 TaxID=2921416 RepID=UPI00315A005B